MVPMKTPVRLTFLGCGRIGKALLGALLPSVSQAGSAVSDITVALRCKESETRLRGLFNDTRAPVNFVSNRTLEAVQTADAVLFAFPPEEIRHVINSTDMKDALRSKIVISILARTPRTDIKQLIHGNHSRDSAIECPQIIRAMPTIGTGIHESATLIADHGLLGEREGLELATWIFNAVGKVFHVTPNYFDTATGVSAFCNALTTVSTQMIVQKAISEAVPVDHAVKIACQCIRGSASLMLSGTSPEELERQLSAPGSITGQAISRLKEGQLQDILEASLSKAIARAKDYHNDQS